MTLSAEDEVRTIDERLCARLVPHPARDANKYTRGALGVIGGSRDYPGAPVLSASAAARCGVGYTRLITTSDAAWAARAHMLSIPVTACPQSSTGTFVAEAVPTVLAACKKSAALAIGPGMGSGAESRGFFAVLLDELVSSEDRRPIVFDADALNVIAADHRILEERVGCDDVLTPHEGEAARLLARPVSDRLSDAHELADRYEATVVLKGPETLVVSPDGRARICKEAGPELAKAGTGDVLTGMVGAFLAQGLSAYDAASLATFMHGRAGGLAAGQMSVNAVMPEDIISFIGPAFLSMGA